MAKKKAAKKIAEAPVAAVPAIEVPPDGLWIEDEAGLWVIPNDGYGDKPYTVNVNGRVYHHTKERANGDWVYAPTRMK